MKKRSDAPRRAAFYLRVSTGEQTTANQRRELDEAAARHGWTVVSVFEDAGISGARGRQQRPGLDALLKGVARREFDIVAAWAVDRLGRSLRDLVSLLGELRAKDVDLYLHKQGLDTSTPHGEAMFQMVGVFSQFEAAIIKERVKAGLARAKEEQSRGTRPRGKKAIGRPRTPTKVEADIRAARAMGHGIRKIATDLHVGVGTVLRVTRAAEAAGTGDKQSLDLNAA
jgi:DNA invertase Pin-like site-specific DNA recombinase